VSGSLGRMRSGWLLRDGDVVCALELAESSSERGALRGRNGCDGALHVEGVRAVHTVGMRFTIDVAFLAGDRTVLRVARLKPWRVALGGRHVRSAVEAEAGALERWGVRVGDQLEVRDAPNGDGRNGDGRTGDGPAGNSRAADGPAGNSRTGDGLRGGGVGDGLR
jgi:uncharacterized protein